MITVFGGLPQIEVTSTPFILTFYKHQSKDKSTTCDCVSVYITLEGMKNTEKKVGTETN